MKPGQQRHASLDEFILLCSSSGFLENPNFSPSCPLFSFNKSMMTVVEELNKDKPFEMNLVEFYEALGRIADELSLVPLKGSFRENKVWNN